ncbi:hypothetical protein CEXT_143751 [Caerostris extrusa]|uniref:Uncharacterized protein n=1 Tax=Caerostris extrusa TaxID=172846 RepID=A0AAV4WZS9_CAEEX|nr:hypothetical protein CEXT_143751 [Caerostris extrusa]
MNYPLGWRMDTSFSRTNMMNVCEPGFGNTGLSAGVFNKISIDGDSSGEIQGWFEDALKDWEILHLGMNFPFIDDSSMNGMDVTFIDDSSKNDSSMNGKTYPIYRFFFYVWNESIPFIDDSSMNGMEGFFIDDSSMNGKTCPIYRLFFYVWKFYECDIPFIDDSSLNGMNFPFIEDSS